MKSFFGHGTFLVTLQLFSSAGFCSAFYSQSIYVVKHTNNQLLDRSVTDLKTFLQMGTGKEFSVFQHTAAPAKGIYILLNQPGLLSSDLEKRINNGSIEDFVMVADQNRLLLVANDPTGLSRAIYSYLDQLGFKWYFPGDEWTFYPQLSNITLVEKKFVSPSFKLRDFAGTGGILPLKPLDPSASLQQKWGDWKRRNRMGGQFFLNGHYGETFNLKYREELEKHPEYLALVKGKRQWTSTAKWCISNKDFRDLFIRDRIEELKSRLQQSTSANEIIPVSVEPADGYEECECENCKKLGAPSERTFFLANETAKQLQKISPRGYANLYAYNLHAAPPAFPLTKGLMVQLIPYAFQSYATPEEMISQWNKRHSNLMIYDYYGIPDWFWNVPLTKIWGLSTVANKLKYWNEKGINGFMYESSFSIGSNGLGLYLSARLGWDINENWSTFMQSFYKQLFGSASKYVQEYFEKLDKDFSGAADVPYLIDLLYQASKNTSNPQIQQRISMLKSYVHYLTLYYRQKQEPKNHDLLVELFQYALQTYPSAMIHSTYIAELLYRQFAEGTTDRAQWQIYEPLGLNVMRVKFLDYSTIENDFAKDRELYPLLEGFNYAAKKKSLPYIIKDKLQTDNQKKEGMMILELPETYVQPNSDGLITFMLKVNEGSTNNEHQTVTIKLTDAATGKEIHTEKLDIDRNWKTVRFGALAVKRYKLTITNPNWIRFAVPSNQFIAFKTIPTYSVLGRLWFYNDNESKFLYFSNTAPDQPVFSDTNGRRATIEKVGDLYRIKTIPNTWWTLDATEYKFLQFYNSNLLFFPHANFTVN